MDLVQTVERAAARNLLDYVEATPDGRAVEVAGGIAAFTGRGSPLTVVKGAGPNISDADVDAAEDFYRNHGLHTVVFELAPWITPDSRFTLVRRGYVLIGQENVVIKERPFEADEPSLTVAEVAISDWPSLMFTLNGITEPEAWMGIIGASALLPGVVRLGVKNDMGEWIACAQIQHTPIVAIFGNDATRKSARGRGAQTSLIQDRLRRIVSSSYDIAMAEVAPGCASERNYFRQGFRLLYTRSAYARSIS